MAAPAKSPDTKKREKKDPRAQWQKIAPKRIDRTLKSVAGLAKLARPSAYTWTSAELEKMLTALGNAFEHCERSFRNPGTTAMKEGFRF